MKTSDFDYDLPPGLIAQTPIEPRDAARLFQLDRTSGSMGHFHFYDLPDLLVPGICWWRMKAVSFPRASSRIRPGTGGAVEILLLRRIDEVTWQALLRSHRVQTGTRIEVGPI